MDAASSLTGAQHVPGISYSANLDSSDTEYTISGLVATSTTTALQFLARQDPGYNQLDNVSVTDNSAAPDVLAGVASEDGF